MQMFEANSTASARLIRIAYLKLYNRLKVQLVTNMMRKIHNDDAHQPQAKQVLPQQEEKDAIFYSIEEVEEEVSDAFTEIVV